MSELICDVCGSTENVQCEILTMGDRVDRVYHLCSAHWIDVYRRTLDDFLEQNEYRVNSHIKMIADKLIVDAQHNTKMEKHINEEGQLDLEGLEPVEVRRLKNASDELNEQD